MDLDWWADVATVVSSAATLLIALVGNVGERAAARGQLLVGLDEFYMTEASTKFTLGLDANADANPDDIGRY